MTQDQQLSQEYDRGKVFEYIAELSGARILKDFKVQPGEQPTVQPNLMPDQQLQGQAQAGNVVPLPRTPRGMPGPMSSVPSPVSNMPMPAMGPPGGG